MPKHITFPVVTPGQKRAQDAAKKALEAEEQRVKDAEKRSILDADTLDRQRARGFLGPTGDTRHEGFAPAAGIQSTPPAGDPGISHERLMGRRFDQPSRTVITSDAGFDIRPFQQVPSREPLESRLTGETQVPPQVTRDRIGPTDPRFGGLQPHEAEQFRGDPLTRRNPIFNKFVIEEEQRRKAEQAAKIKAGAVGPGGVSRESIETAEETVRRLMSDPSFSDKAAAVLSGILKVPQNFITAEIIEPTLVGLATSSLHSGDITEKREAPEWLKEAEARGDERAFRLLHADGLEGFVNAIVGVGGVGIQGVTAANFGRTFKAGKSILDNLNKGRTLGGELTRFTRTGAIADASAGAATRQTVRGAFANTRAGQAQRAAGTAEGVGLQATKRAQNRQSILDKLDRGIRTAESISQETEGEVHEVLQQISGSFGKARKAASGEAGALSREVRGKLGVSRPKANDITAPRGVLQQSEVDMLYDIIRETDGLRPFTMANTDEALKMLLDGKIPTKSQLQLLENVFGDDIVAAILSRRGLGFKALQMGLDIANIPRSVVASIDLSMLGRQGLITSISHPRQGAGSFWKSLRALGGEEATNAIHDARLAKSSTDLAKQTGLYMAPVKKGTGKAGGLQIRDEEFLSTFASKFAPIRWSERAALTHMNELRYGTHEVVMQGWAKHALRRIKLGGETTGFEKNAIRGLGPEADAALTKALAARKIARGAAQPKQRLPQVQQNPLRIPCITAHGPVM